jgi:hypothetical protein
MARVSGRFFYRIFLPAAVAANLTLGVLILSQLRPASWLDWLVIMTGAFCCGVAGWLAASAWSRSYWSGAMARQVAVWRQMIDAIFEWLEEAPVSAHSLQGLKLNLEDALGAKNAAAATAAPIPSAARPGALRGSPPPPR